MNKLCYRIVFNKPRGMCMVVQETANSRSKGPGMGTAGGTVSNVMHLPALRWLALLVCVGLGGTGFAGAALAQIVADPHAPGQQRATVLNAANGALQVNIQTPSEGGVSRNVYSQFDVPKSGAILNNSRTSVQTQLGGWVQGNPWLATGTARVILNEVNSSNPSRLQGYIEIAGARAETIIANPAGIVVDGGGFINVSRATLTTGTPLLDDGRVKGYSVQRGQIVIDGAGLDASKTDYTALIARSLQVNAGLWAQRLNIVTGVNDVAEGEQAVVTQSGQASATAPAYAVDVARLGGMYAGQIYLVGTETGVGVHNAGAIGAGAGDLVVTAAGRLENGGMLSATGNLKVDASAIDNHGRAQAGGTLALTAGSMLNTGLLSSGREASIAMQGEIDNSHGRIEAPRIDLTAASLRNAQGSIVQSGLQALAINAADVINTAGVIGRRSGLTAAGSAPAVGTGTSPDGTATAPAQDGTTAPDTGSPAAPAVPALADGRVQVGTLDNAAGVIASNGATLLRTGSLDNHAGQGVLDTLAVSGPTFDNTGGTLTVLHGFDAHAGRFVNDQGKVLVAAAFNGALGAFSNRQGLLQAAQVGIQATGPFDNSGGTIQATHDLTLQSSDAILNAAGNIGTLSGTSTMSVTGAAIDNGDGRIVNAGSGATVMRADAITSRGLIGGNGNLDIAAHRVQNDAGGVVTARGDLNLMADILFANAGRVDAGGRLRMLQDGAQLNNSGTMVAQGAIDVRVASIDNGAGTIATTAGTGSHVALAAGSFVNRAGTIVADRQAALAIRGSVDNEHGHIRAATGLSLLAAGRIENRGGDIESAGSLLLHGADIGNDGGHIAAAGTQATVVEADRAIESNGSIRTNGHLILRAQTLANGTAGAIGAGGDLDLAVSTAVVNGGAIGTAGTLQLDQPHASLVNHGSMTAAAQVHLNVDRADNRDGRLIARGDASVLVSDAVDNGKGVMQAGGSLAVTAGAALRNHDGTIAADGLLHAAFTGVIANDAGMLHGGAGASLHAGGLFDNGSGIIESAAGALDISAQSIASGGRIVNAGTGQTSVVAQGDIVNAGSLVGNAKVRLAATTLQNTRSGSMASGADLDLAVRGRLDNGGTIDAAGKLRFDQADASVGNTGRIGAGADIDLTASALANRGGQIYTATGSGGTIRVRAKSLDNAGGTILADSLLHAQFAEGVGNDRGKLHGGAGVRLSTDSVLRNGSGTIEAGKGALELKAASVLSSGSIVNAGVGATNIASAADLDNGGTIAGNGTLAMTAGTLHNRSGGTISSSGAMELAAREQLVNAGTIGSGGRLYVDQTAAGLANTGTIGAAGALDLSVRTIDNAGGLLYTSSGSEGAIALHASSLRNVGGIVAADGLLTGVVAGDVVNDAGTLHGGAGTVLHVGRTLANGSGTIAARIGMLDIEATSIASDGRIVNGGTGLTTMASQDALVNRGVIGANGSVDLHAAALQNVGGQIKSGGGVLLDVRKTLINTGAISSGGSLTFDQAGASFANSGRISAGGAIRLVGGVFGNDGGQIATMRGSGSDIVVSASSLSNRSGSILADGNATLSSAGSVDNDKGELQAGRNLALMATGSVGNDGGAIEALGSLSTLRVEGDTIDNGSGRISNAGSGATWVQAHSAIDNRGTIVGRGSVFLSGQSLSNASGATLASGNNLTLGVSQRLANFGKMNSAGALTFDEAGATFTNGGEILAGGSTIIHANIVNNDGGRLGTTSGSGASLALTSQQLSNQGGRIATDGDLRVDTHLVTGLGELFAGRDLTLSMDGDFAQDGVQQVHSNRNLTLSVTGNVENGSTLAAGGTLMLTGRNIANGAGAVIEGQRVVLNASAGLSNAGEIDGSDTLDIHAATVGNAGAIVGGNVALATARLDNASSSALIGATRTLNLNVSDVLTNTGGATLYSSGDMTIAGRCGCDVGTVNNTSSTIEAGGNLTLKADSLRNVRENVQIVQVATVDETVHMTMPDWRKYGDNHDSFDKEAANYRPHEVYFLRPSDILEDQTYVTPDGNTVHRAVIRTHANDSAFYVAFSGLYGAYGSQSRLTLSEGTRVIYYMESARLANPDQDNGAHGNAIAHADSVTHWDSSISFSNQYGNCSDDCIRLVTQPEYTDPRTTRIVDDSHALEPVTAKLELSLDAHHTALEDQLAPGAGAAAQILSGGNMHLTVGSMLENRFGDIKARGRLAIDGTAAIDNVGTTLYRTHTFDGTWETYEGQAISYQRPAISEAIGSVAGVIQGDQGVGIVGRSFRNVDVSAGSVGNIRDAVNVIGIGSTPASHGESDAGLSGDRMSADSSLERSGSAGVSAGTGAAGHVITGGVTAVNRDGTAHDIRVSAPAHGSGPVGEGRLGGTVAAARNTIGLGDVHVTGAAPADRQADRGADGMAGPVVKENPGGLFLRNPDSHASYLFETRPQFANQREWVSSDYLLKQLAFDPATTQKRLGDGFYEQRLVREQLAELTGHASYSGASDDSIYKELLTNAVSVAREFGLRPGVALSAEQVSRLTSDIAWMETQTVLLPDGRTEAVLVPKVYLAHVGKHALQPNGALVTGNDVAIMTTDSIVDKGGSIDGGNGRTVLVAARDIVNQGGSIKGDAVTLAAGRDIRNESLAVTQTYDFGRNGGSDTSLSNQATIRAAGALNIGAGRDLSDVAGRISAGSANLTAGRDVKFDALKTGSTYRSQIDRVTEKDSAVTHQLSQISTTGDLKMTATGDLKLIGTQVAIGTAGQGSGQLVAGGSVAIASAANEIDTSVRNDPHSKRYDKQVHENQSVVGADLSATGSLTVAAGLLQTGVLTVTGSSLTAGDALKLTASDSVGIIAAQGNHLSDTASARSSHGLLKSKTAQQADYVASTDAVGSALSGKTVEVGAGRDINVLGSGIAGDVGVRLSANGSVSIEAATRTVTEQHHSQVKESGFLSGDGFGFSIGTRTTTTDQSRDATTQSGQSRSVVGAVHGNLDIVAGDAIKIGGSDLAAGSNMTLDGRSVVINAGEDNAKNAFKQTTVQNGLSFAVGGSVVNAVQTTQRMSSAAAQAKDARFKALAAATAVRTANDAVDDLAKNGPSVRISVTAGHSESESTQVTTASTHTGSVLTAGGNVTISATGGGKGSNLDIIGSEIRGAGSVALIADSDINVLAAHDTDSQHSKSRSTSAAVGVAANIGASGMKVGVTASASASRGNVDGDGTTQVDSHVIAGEQLTVASGADTNLRGAVVSGRQVVADIKGNLNIESLQDMASLDGKRQSASAAGTLGAGAGVSASASLSKVHNDFASVAEQSGIRAGDGGFHIQVAANTDLKGGVISSSDVAIKDGRNSLVTGSLSYKDIQNHDKTEASGISLGGNVAANQNGGTFSPGMAPGIGHVSGEQSSVTRSGISGGELKVADRAGDVAGLNRDVTTGKDTTQALVKAWNGAKALDEVGAQMEITSAAMPRLAKEIGDYAENKIVELKEQGNLEEAAKWEEGGVYRVAAHAALGAMGGGLGGALGATAAAEAAPTLGRLQSALQEKLADAGLASGAADAAAKLLVGGAAGTIAGAVGGGAGAAAGVNADLNNRQLHESETRKLEALKRGKPADAQHRLDAAACALVHCADGVPKDDPVYSYLEGLQVEGQNYSTEKGALKATGEFVYQPYLDTARDTLTSHAELLHRTGGGAGAVLGTYGMVAGGAVTVGGVTACLETGGLGCAVGTFGAYVASASAKQAREGSLALFGQFQSDEGQRVFDSFNRGSFPGEKDPLAQTGIDTLKLGITALAGKFAPKIISAAEESVTTSSVTRLKTSATNSYPNRIVGDEPYSPDGLSPGGITHEVKPIVLSSANPPFTYNMIENPGPLATLRNNPASNFFSGQYNATVLADDVVLYRAGEAGKPLGQWFTLEAPQSMAQVRIDSAVKSQWISAHDGVLTGTSPINTVFAVKIPKGTVIYDGPVGYQGGVYLGGANTNQIFVETPWEIHGVSVISGKPLK